MQPLIFFAIITTLFPLAISPALDELRTHRARRRLGCGDARFAAGA